MKSIDRNDFLLIGTIARLHGTKGELKVRLNNASDHKFLKEKEWTFLEIGKKPVPFFIVSLKGVVENEAILGLRDINTFEEAENLMGLNILAPSKGKKQKTTKPDKSLIGYMLVDEDLGEIGEIEALEELPEQLMFVLHYKDNEVMVPAVEEFIISIDDKKKVILAKLPEGLLEI